MPFLVLRKVLELCLLGSPYQLFCPLQSYVHLCFGPTATYFNQLSQCGLESLAPLPSCPPESCLDLPRRVWTPPHCASHTTSSPHLPRKAAGFLGVGLQQGVLTSHSSPETADGMMKTCSAKGEPTASTAHPQVSAQSSCSTNYLAGQQNTSDAYILSPTPRGLLYPELGAPICTSSWSLTTVENLGKSSLS